MTLPAASSYYNYCYLPSKSTHIYMDKALGITDTNSSEDEAVSVTDVPSGVSHYTTDWQ